MIDVGKAVSDYWHVFTATAVFSWWLVVHIRRRIKIHYENPVVRKNDMDACKSELLVCINGNADEIAGLRTDMSENHKELLNTIIGLNE